MKITLLAGRNLPDERLHDTAHRLLNALAAERGLTVPLTLAEEAGGKPYCPDHPDFCFNLSHSGGWAVVAAADCPVGVDVQEEKGRIFPALLQKFSQEEQEQLAVRPQRAFFDLWALKEAAAKCTGRCGMTGVLYGSRVTLSTCDLGMEGISAALVPFGERLHLAVAAQTEEPLEIVLKIV